jgi:hypothetical protein
VLSIPLPSPNPTSLRTAIPFPRARPRPTDTPAQITSHLERLQTVEKELAAIKSAAAPKDDVAKVRGEMKKVYVSKSLG